MANVSVKGDTLTIARVDKYPDGRIRENTQVWSLNAEGNLVIEATDGLRSEVLSPTRSRSSSSMRPYTTPNY